MSERELDSFIKFKEGEDCSRMDTLCRGGLQYALTCVHKESNAHTDDRGGGLLWKDD